MIINLSIQQYDAVDIFLQNSTRDKSYVERSMVNKVRRLFQDKQDADPEFMILLDSVTVVIGKCKELTDKW